MWEKYGRNLRYNCGNAIVKVRLNPTTLKGLLMHKDMHSTNILICLGDHKLTDQKLIGKSICKECFLYEFDL